MKKISLLLIIVSFGQILIAQEQINDSDLKKRKELFINGSGLLFNNPTFTYKKESRTKNNFFKIGISQLKYTSNTDLQGTLDNIDEDKVNYEIRAGLILGFEKRKQISEKLDLYHGLSFNPSFYTNKNKRSSGEELDYQNHETTTHRYGLNIPYTIGFLYNIKPWLGFGFEFNPSIGSSFTTNQIFNQNGLTVNRDEKNNKLDYGVTISSGLNLSLAIRLSEL